MSATTRFWAFHSHELHVLKIGDRPAKHVIHRGNVERHREDFATMAHHTGRTDLAIVVEPAPAEAAELPQVRALIEALDHRDGLRRGQASRRDKRRARAAMRKAKRYEAACRWTREVLRKERVRDAISRRLDLACAEWERLPAAVAEWKKSQIIAAIDARRGTTVARSCSAVAVATGAR